MLGVALTLGLWSHASRLSAQNAQEMFTQRVDLANLAIDRVFGELTSLLSMVKSIAETDPSFERPLFNATLRGQNQRLFSAGLQYIGFIKASAASECTDPTTGLPSATGGAPAMLGEGCLSLDMVYPRPTNEHVLGQLQVTERPDLSGAIIRAMDYGYLALTPPLPASRNNHAQPGLIIYLPVYQRNESLATVPARRQALAGMVVAAMSLEDMVRAELGGEYFETTNVRIRDFGLVGRARASNADSTVVLDARSLLRPTANADLASAIALEDGTSNRQQVSFNRQPAGRYWSVEFAEISPASSLSNVLTAPRMVLLLGALMTAALCAYLHILSRGRRQAERLASRMTQHLHEREGQLRQALDAADMGSWTWRADHSGFDADSRAMNLLGLGSGEIGRLFDQLRSEDQVTAERALERSISENTSFYVEGRLKPTEQGTRWVELSAQLSLSDDKTVTRATGLVRDITQRVEVLLAKRQLHGKLIYAEERERRRIARELHDQLGQEITALSLGLRNLEQMTNASAARSDLLSGLKKLVGEIDTRVDRFTLDLRPVVLDDLGLEAALQAHFSQWTDVHGIELNSHLAGLAGAKLPFEHTTTVFRVVQESLTNVARHAQASRVDVIVELSEAEIRVVIEDNGTGRLKPVEPQSYGLMGMSERVEALGGQFRAESSPDAGFSVFVRLPVTVESTALASQ
ncbi:MAG: CHASE domain-containing protein [Burkholderiaceae bacterium]